MSRFYGGLDTLPSIAAAIDGIEVATGDRVSASLKKKGLNKFGKAQNADAGARTTVANFQDDEINETFVTTNLIDSAVSTSASDTETIVIEGHTIDGNGLLTFAVQEVTLTGQSAASLPTPLARASRAYVKNGSFATPAGDLVGDVAIYDDTGVSLSGGKPSIDAAVKLMISGTRGANQSEKCATSLSNEDYWIITAAAFSITSGSASGVAAEFEIEYRDVANGGVWRPLGLESSLTLPGQSHVRDPLSVPIWIAKNTDVRAIVIADTNNTTVDARISGYLAKVLP